MSESHPLKVLRLDPDQARLLASWVRMGAGKLDEEAKRLRSCGHSFNEVADINDDQARRARALADRLCG